VGHEFSLVIQIFRKCILSREGRSFDIASVFARDGIPGYIFLEGSLPAASQAVRGLAIVRRDPLRLVPPEQRIGLLASRNPLSRRIAEGQWVRCVHGMYRGDIGFVCDWDPSSDLEVVVAFVPRIPHRSGMQTSCSTGKRKRPSRPLPRPWTSAEVAAEWGLDRVQATTPEIFKFQNDIYESGLVMKRCAPYGLVIVDGAPANLDLFLAAPCIRERSSFIPWIHRFAQDTIKERQRVIVESGEQKGVVGYVREIVGAVASVVTASHVEDPSSPVPHVLLRNLAPHYLPGDNVKDRWRDSDGIVQSVDGERKTLVYVERATHNQVSATTS
jgi:Early transcription elongation factor of RNA pol II, NGN section